MNKWGEEVEINGVGKVGINRVREIGMNGVRKG